MTIPDDDQIILVVDRESAGERLDKYIAAALADVLAPFARQVRVQPQRGGRAFPLRRDRTRSKQTNKRSARDYSSTAHRMRQRGEVPEYCEVRGATGSELDSCRRERAARLMVRHSLTATRA